jgi:hypothetical protein
MAFVQLQRPVTFLATKFGVAIQYSISNTLDLPERLIASAGSDTPAFHFALKQLLCN